MTINRRLLRGKMLLIATTPLLRLTAALQMKIKKVISLPFLHRLRSEFIAVNDLTMILQPVTVLRHFRP
jgi:hypothetical protein